MRALIFFAAASLAPVAAQACKYDEQFGSHSAYLASSDYTSGGERESDRAQAMDARRDAFLSQYNVQVDAAQDSATPSTDSYTPPDL